MKLRFAILRDIPDTKGNYLVLEYDEDMFWEGFREKVIRSLPKVKKGILNGKKWSTKDFERAMDTAYNDMVNEVKKGTVAII